MKHVLNTIIVVLFSLISKAQTILPYYTAFDNTAQTAGWQEFRKGAANPGYRWTYESFGAYTAPYSLSHRYPVGDSVATDDWFVSPGFTIPAGGRVDSVRSAFYGFGVPYPDDTVAIYLLTGSPDPALATAKTMLLDYRGANYSNDDTWRKQTISLPPTNGTCYLALKYKTIGNWLDVRFDNLKISGVGSTSLQHQQYLQDAITIYPNPASKTAQIRFGGQAAVPVIVKLYNTLGELQTEQSIREHELLHVNLKNGAYFYTIVTCNGEQLKSGKLIVENR